MRVNAEKENIPKCGILETPQRRNLPGGGGGGRWRQESCLPSTL